MLSDAILPLFCKGARHETTNTAERACDVAAARARANAVENRQPDLGAEEPVDGCTDAPAWCFGRSGAWRRRLLLDAASGEARQGGLRQDRSAGARRLRLSRQREAA